MALSQLAGWNLTMNASSCGSSCGAQDEQSEKPASCGSSCGAEDK